MDAGKVIPENGFEEAHQNGVHEQFTDARDNGSSLNGDGGVTEKPSDIAMLMGNLENVKLEDPVTEDNSSLCNLRDDAHFELHKDEEALTSEHSKPSKPLKNEGNKKHEKLSSTKTVSATGPKKIKDGKGSEGNAYSAVGSVGQAKQTVKSRSFNDKQPQKSKQNRDEKSDAPTSDGLGERTKLKPLKKGLPDKQEEDDQSSLSPREEDAKPRRIGALPNYGFSFRCDERAEKRREFYSKLEEKIHAKEVEKTNQQVKSKETQEAEIKLLRKSLTFKATPMPSFYQEPAPPKAELKKIPTTRAKSPKLGRRKSSTGEESDENTPHRPRVGRLSLDGGSRNYPIKATPPANSKKPQRKSLPVSSEKTSLSSASGKSANLSNAIDEEETTLPSAGMEEKYTSSIETCEAASVNQEVEPIPAAEVDKGHDHADDAELGNAEESVAVEH